VLRAQYEAAATGIRAEFLAEEIQNGEGDGVIAEAMGQGPPVNMSMPTLSIFGFC